MLGCLPVSSGHACVRRPGPLATVEREPDPRRPSQKLRPGNMGLEPVAKVPVSQWLDYNTWRRELGAAIFYVPRGLRKEDWGKGDRGRACPPRAQL